MSNFVTRRARSFRCFGPVFLGMLLLNLLAVSGALRAENEAERVQRDVRSLMEATYSRDVEGVLRLTHPRVLELMGGKDAARVATVAALTSISRLQLKIGKMTFPQPPIFFKGATRRYVFVPTLSVVSATGGQMLESLNYQLGILEPGTSQWKYVEGSRVNQSNARQIFSDFPSDIEFPRFYRRKL